MPNLPFKYWILIFYGLYLLIISIGAAGIYAADKKKAEKGKWRISEKVLLGIALLGGAFGSYPAMLIFRHKTKGEHWYFTFCNILGLIIHITAIVLIFLLVKKDWLCQSFLSPEANGVNKVAVPSCDLICDAFTIKF